MRIVLGFLSGILVGLAGWFALASLTMALSGPDRDGGLAMAAVLFIGPIGGLAGFVAGVLLFWKLGLVRHAESASDIPPNTTQPGAARRPSRTRISRPFAAIVLAIAGGLGWWGWHEFIRSPYLTHGADAEMTLALQFRLPAGMALPEHSEDLEIKVDDGDWRAVMYYGEKWFHDGKWRLQDGDRAVLLASAELSRKTFWRRVYLKLPNLPEQIWTLDLASDPYPILDYSPWRAADHAHTSGIELRFTLTADRCAICAFGNLSQTGTTP